MIIRTGKAVLSRCFNVDLQAAWALSNEVGYHALASVGLAHAQAPTEELVSQPQLVRVDDITDAVARDLDDPPCKRRSKNPSVKQPSWSVAPE